MSGLRLEAVKNATLIAMTALARPVRSEATALELDSKALAQFLQHKKTLAPT